MNIKFAYLGHSTLSSVAGGQLLSLAPNLASPPAWARLRDATPPTHNETYPGL